MSKILVTGAATAAAGGRSLSWIPQAAEAPMGTLGVAPAHLVPDVQS